MQITEQTIVLAITNPPSLWNFYTHPTLAAADLDRANTSHQETYPNAPSYRVMTYGQYKEAERAFYLADPPIVITSEAFFEMLGCLPPERYEHHGDFESFLCAEHYSGPFTHQYVRHGDRYYSKMVDALDRRTWITRDTLTTHPQQESN